ncbi:electron transport complex protein RnfD [Anaerotaenia torta]|uniref:RnfABCDGE type electron transport complex subunit D n=1 Tax=Anaerotaenia torta TaxID=433293 RepID=UPI003D1D873B
MSDLIHVSAAPHSRGPVTTKRIMLDVILALVPAGIFGVYNFGINALLLIAVTVAACVLTEYLYCRFMKLPLSVGDYSAVVTGLLLAYNLPANFPFWMAILGGVFAILIVKMLFGGLGQNFMNPALAARVFLLISFPVRMTSFTIEKIASPGAMDYVRHGFMALDGVSGATPLAAMKAGETVDLYRMLFGNIGGTIGETSAIAILLGAAYLLLKKVISFRIPLTYILSLGVFVLIFGGRGFDMTFVLGHILGGGLLLGAFFMATDYVTSPITAPGQIVFGISLGLLTGLFRLMGGTAEGVSYAIIFCNLLVPLIEKATRQKSFGKERAVREK